MQVQELQRMHSCKRGLTRQSFQLVIAQIDLLQLSECVEQLKIFDLVVLQVKYSQVGAVGEALQAVFKLS